MTMPQVILHPFHPVAATEIFRDLDGWDRAEAEVTLGFDLGPEDMAAYWQGLDGFALYHAVASTGGQPFAVVSLSSAGMAGCGQAALMARDHRRFRRPLASLALRVRAELPALARRLNLTRIEARSWAAHPTAPRILRALDFTHECDLAGLGPDGRSLFRQWAWVDPACRPANLPFTPHQRT